MRKQVCFWITAITLMIAIGGGMYVNADVHLSNGPVLEFLDDQLDVGTLPVSSLRPFEEQIKFANRGDQPLILSNVRGCCGTRITQWPQVPIMPGETSHIEVHFRLASRPHAVRRTVTVTSNATNPTQVHRIVGQVVADGVDPVAETQPNPARQPAVQTLGPKIQFAHSFLDLGAVTASDDQSVPARICFSNQGDAPLQLAHVRAGQGTTITTWPSDPIPPGEYGAIEMEIVSQGESRSFSRNVFILSNDSARRHIYRVVGQWEMP